MQSPLKITFRNIDPSPAIEAAIREKVEKIDHHYPGMISCNVIVSLPHQHQSKGQTYSVHVDIKMPDHKNILVTHENGKNHAHEDAYVAIRDAFDAATRQLRTLHQKHAGEVKVHEMWPEGTIVALYPMENYGEIQTSDGRDIYFHRNSVLNAAFDQLQEGSRVVFTEEQGEDGPQAIGVKLV